MLACLVVDQLYKTFHCVTRIGSLCLCLSKIKHWLNKGQRQNSSSTYRILKIWKLLCPASKTGSPTAAATLGLFLKKPSPVRTAWLPIRLVQWVGRWAGQKTLPQRWLLPLPVKGNRMQGHGHHLRGLLCSLWHFADVITYMCFLFTWISKGWQKVYNVLQTFHEL